MTRTRSALRVAMGALIALSFAAAGCGDDDTRSAGSDAAPPAATTTAAADASSETGSVLDAHYKGTFKDFPASAPKPEPGKNLWVVSLNEASPGVHIATENVVQAAKVLKWRTRVVDTKGSPDAATAGIKQAIADKADAIVLNVIECRVVEGAAKQAKAAGIKLIGTTAADCDAPNVGRKALYDSVNAFADGGFFDFMHLRAKVVADWALAQLADDPGKVLVMHETDYYGLTVHDKDFTTALEQGCAECKAENVDFVYSDVGAPLKGKVQSALVKNPDAKMMLFPYDALLSLGGAAAIQGSGQAGKLKAMGGECAESTLELIRSNVVTACVGTPYSWLGWQVVDQANRLLAGEKPAKSTVGLQLIDKDHGMPAKGADYDGPGTDFRAAYKKLWTGAG